MKRGWSQQQLADLSGLSVRTIQRMEQGQPAALESYKALGAAFNVDFAELQEQTVRDMTSDADKTELALAFAHVRAVRKFYFGLFTYVVVMALLAGINLATSPHHLWFVFPLLGWGVGLALRATRVFGLLPWFGPEWEKAQVEKRLGRPLA
ncbi:MAG TPA: helix-turn-helix domain-containing protein, partial [Novosphingobium sp.]|nr:helix-turn-helix domain-containing protein [Novosphingobium sp.]